MRKMNRLIVALFATVLMSSAVNAQQTAVKASYLAPVFGIINIGVEHAFSDVISVQAQPFYWPGGETGGTSYSGFGGNLDVRIYPSGNALKGFFVAPGLRYMGFTGEEDVSGANAKLNTSVFGIGAIIGGQFVFGDLITLDVYGGPWYASGSASYEDDVSGASASPIFDGFLVRFGSTIGVAF